MPGPAATESPNSAAASTEDSANSPWPGRRRAVGWRGRNSDAGRRAMNGFVALRVGIKIAEAQHRQGLRAGLRRDEGLLENLFALVSQRIGGIECGLWRVG